MKNPDLQKLRHIGTLNPAGQTGRFAPPSPSDRGNFPCQSRTAGEIVGSKAGLINVLPGFYICRTTLDCHACYSLRTLNIN
jgi:hypothetical protein